jgi:hypothetical protein
MDKNTYKTLGDAVGMPDETDKQNIQKIILRYEKKNPGEIKQIIDYARKHSKAMENEFGLITEQNAKGISSTSVRYLLELPPKLHEQIEAYIPTIFRDKKHFRWFCKNFKNLLLVEKY